MEVKAVTELKVSEKKKNKKPKKAKGKKAKGCHLFVKFSISTDVALFQSGI